MLYLSHDHLLFLLLVAFQRSLPKKSRYFNLTIFPSAQQLSIPSIRYFAHGVLSFHLEMDLLTKFRLHQALQQKRKQEEEANNGLTDEKKQRLLESLEMRIPSTIELLPGMFFRKL